MEESDLDPGPGVFFICLADAAQLATFSHCGGLGFVRRRLASRRLISKALRHQPSKEQQAKSNNALRCRSNEFIAPYHDSETQVKFSCFREEF